MKLLYTALTEIHLSLLLTFFHTTSASTWKEGTCRTPLDVVFLVDTNLPPDYGDTFGFPWDWDPLDDFYDNFHGNFQENWRLKLEFLENIVRHLNVDDTGSQIGFILNSRDHSMDFDLNSFTTREEIIGHILYANYRGPSDLDYGLEKLMHQFTPCKGDRRDIPNIGIVIIDEQRSVSDMIRISQIAREAEKENIRLFAVGVRMKTNSSLLATISSPPHKLNQTWWNSTDFETLDQFGPLVLKAMCEGLVEKPLLHANKDTVNTESAVKLTCDIANANGNITWYQWTINGEETRNSTRKVMVHNKGPEEEKLNIYCVAGNLFGKTKESNSVEIAIQNYFEDQKVDWTTIILGSLLGLSLVYSIIVTACLMLRKKTPQDEKKSKHDEKSVNGNCYEVPTAAKSVEPYQTLTNGHTSAYEVPVAEKSVDPYQTLANGNMSAYEVPVETGRSDYINIEK